MTPTYPDMFRVFGRIGLLSFGGPAAQIGLMHKELVEDRDWLTQDQYLRALSFCMLLPGPEAMQLATYAGWRQRGILGGLLAGLLFVIPGAILITVLALAYSAYGTLDWVQAMFLGVKATVVIIVIGALRKVAKNALGGFFAITIAVTAFIALFAFSYPFPLVIAVAAVCGALGLAKPSMPIAVKLSWKTPLIVIVMGAVLWFIPLGVAMIWQAAFLTEVGLFFSKLAIVSFGGAYAVLAYMTQTVVADYGWISTAQMMDALGLAETTPGPLILVTQFVGMIAGVAHGGTELAILAGLLTLWVTFVPCFIWIFAGAPLIDWLAGQPRLQGALEGITAAVVGVFANLTLWFAMHVFFDNVGTTTLGPARFAWPDVSTLVIPAICLAIVAGGMLLWRKWSLLLVLPIMAVLALALHLTGLT